jgi:hypothetical protein
MKKTRKIFAVALAALLIVSVLPLSASADSGDPLTTDTTVQGVAITGEGTANTTFATVGKGSVTLSQDQAAKTDVPIIVAGIDTNEDSYTVVRIPYADVKAGTYTEVDFDTPDTGLATANAYSQGALAAGDWIVIGVDEGTTTYAAAENFYIIAVSVAGTIIGESTVDDVTVNVSLPMNLDFAIDPLDLDDKAGQVTQANYYAVNKTGVPVIVDVDVTAYPKSGVVLVSDPGTLDTDYPAPGVTVDKNAYFGILGAASIAAGNLDYDTIPGTAEFTYIKDTAGTLSVFDSNKASIRFALAAATGGSTKMDTQNALAATNKGVASYTFYAELNTYADWAAGDLDVAGVYTLVPVQTKDVPKQEQIVGLNVVKPAVTVPTEEGFLDDDSNIVGVTSWTRSNATTASGNSTTGNFTSGIKIPFYVADASGITAVVGANDLNPSYDGVNKTLTLTRTFGTAGAKSVVIEVGGHTYTATITLQ